MKELPTCRRAYWLKHSLVSSRTKQVVSPEFLEIKLLQYSSFQITKSGQNSYATMHYSACFVPKERPDDYPCIVKVLYWKFGIHTSMQRAVAFWMNSQTYLVFEKGCRLLICTEVILGETRKKLWQLCIASSMYGKKIISWILRKEITWWWWFHTRTTEFSFILFTLFPPTTNWMEPGEKEVIPLSRLL